jgi:hypothetical protein
MPRPQPTSSPSARARSTTRARVWTLRSREGLSSRPAVEATAVLLGDHPALTAGELNYCLAAAALCHSPASLTRTALTTALPRQRHRWRAVSTRVSRAPLPVTWIWMEIGRSFAATLVSMPTSTVSSWGHAHGRRWGCSYLVARASASRARAALVSRSRIHSGTALAAIPAASIVGTVATPGQSDERASRRSGISQITETAVKHSSDNHGTRKAITIAVP